MFTDKYRFALQSNECVRGLEEQGTHNWLENVTEHHAFCGGSIMVWAGISLGYPTNLPIYRCSSVTAVQYQDAFLNAIVKLLQQLVFHSLQWIMCVYRAAVVEDILEGERIVCMDWSVYMLNLYPIENFCHALGHAVCRCFPPPAPQTYKLPYRSNGDYWTSQWWITLLEA